GTAICRSSRCQKTRRGCKLPGGETRSRTSHLAPRTCYHRFLMLTQIGPRLPEWLRKPWRDVDADHAVKRLMRSHGLNTVCESARCPNRNECFSRGTATFMIGGNVC